MQGWRQRDQVGEAIAARLRISGICRIGAVAAMGRGMIGDTFRRENWQDLVTDLF